MALWQKFLGAFGVAGAAFGAIALALNTMLLRRRTRELNDAKVEGLEAKHAAGNEKREAEISALKAKVEASGKDAQTKAHLLLNILDDGRDASSRRK